MKKVPKLSGVRQATQSKTLPRRKEKMVLAGSTRPLSDLEDLELRRHRLAELITLELVSPSLSAQIKKAIVQIDQQITTMKMPQLQRMAA
jgi:hypothetical protein